MEQRVDVRRVVQQIEQAESVAVLSGAGISKESGVPTFRDAQDGLWAQYDPSELATPEAFRRNPDLVWSWYMYRYELVRRARPNPGHLALADLEDLVPEIVVLTQNVDGLHLEAGSTDVVELHGSLRRFRCFDACQGEPTPVALDQLDLLPGCAPHCPFCSKGLVRPDVLWFGEVLNPILFRRAFDAASRCDVMLVIGTSGIVQPAASLPVVAKESGASIIEINPAPGLTARIADITLQGPSGVVLPELVRGLRS